MAKKELFLKAGSTFFTDPETVTKEVKSGSYVAQIIVKILNRIGIPAVLPCCPSGERVVLVYNRTTGQDEIWLDGAWVPVETASGASTTTTTSTSTTTLP